MYYKSINLIYGACVLHIFCIIRHFCHITQITIHKGRDVENVSAVKDKGGNCMEAKKLDFVEAKKLDYVEIPGGNQMKKTYTVADILALPEGVRAELLDGEMFMMASPTNMHQADSI